MKIQYVKSAVHEDDFPILKKPEVAIAGRSNAGKSSLINAIAGDKVANVSSTPGKTRLLNFFTVGQHYAMVDMPGYGFASRSGGEMLEWEQMIENYLSCREEIVGLILVMDIRRDWDREEDLLKRFVNDQNIALAVALTKSDKISKSEALQKQSRIKRKSGTDLVFILSALKKDGVKEFEDRLFRDWIKT